MNTALEEVKDAEKESERIVEEAHRQRVTIIADARTKATQFLKEKEEELARDKAQTMERQKARIMAAKEKVLAEGLEKLKSLRKSAEKRTDAALECTMESFEKTISIDG